jgi:tetratricopeptide (TPR) repeat protein
VYARYEETSDRIHLAAPHLGNPVICPTMSQCVDYAPLWKDYEFFTAADPAELRRLLVELRFAGQDTVWLHMSATDPLYVNTFPDAKPVWPHHMTIFNAGKLYKTQWRVLELVINRSDSLWSGILETEASRLIAEHHMDEALRVQREAVIVAPNSAQAHSNLALILASLGDMEGACDEATIATQLNPNLTEPRRILEMLRSQTTNAP